MDRAGARVWADTFTQLMAEKKPRDVWVLRPEDSLVAGDLEGGGLQYQLKGLSRLQCSRCPWTWRSAHLQVLFHLWWDGGSGQGLVRMRVWGQQCRLCPLDTLAECQVSPADVHRFLSKLVLHILWRCYEDRGHPGQRAEVLLGDCEACALGLCFLQQAPHPARGPMVKSADAKKGRPAVQGSGSATVASGQQLFNPINGPTPATIPLLVIDFSENLSPASDGLLGGGESTITIPFSLAGGRHKGSLPAPVIGQGSLCLSGSSVAESEHKGIPLDIKAPILHRGGLPGSMQKAFALRGFLFKGQGFFLSPSGMAEGKGPVSFSCGHVSPGGDPPLVSYIVGLMANGEGSLTFPSFLASIINRQDMVSDVAQGKGQEGSGQSTVTDGENPPPETHTQDPTAREEGSVTFPFLVTGDARHEDSLINIAEAQEKGESQDPATAVHVPPLESGAASPTAIRRGTIAIPFSVFSIINHEGPSYPVGGTQSNGLITYSYYQKRRLRSRPGKSSCTHREEDFCSRRAHRRRRTEPSDDFWICVSMTICILWLLCMYRLNLGGL
uniref:3CxxC-type domain-containing protein n=1 Tax=Sciurus vulgaris TaxID=55149 RepID=A0A8D2CX16_SCIVU